MSLYPVISPGVPDAVVTYIGSTYSATNTSTYTFSSHSIGTAAANRTIAVALTGYFDASGVITSVSVGGNSATKRAEVDVTASELEIWDVDVSSGTTGDIVVAVSGTPHRLGVGVWALYGVGTPDDTATDTGTTLSQSLTISAGGVAIAASANYQPSTPTCTWGAGITERYESWIEPNTSHSGGDATGGGTITTAATWSSTGTNDLLVAVAWPKG